MLILYRIYQCIIMIPLGIIVTILAAVTTIIGSALGGYRIFGYYPAVIWAKIICWLTLVRVTVRGRENIDPKTSYMFVANHQGAYDIFSVYGFLGHQFRWMMKKSLEKIPLVGYSCRVSGHIYVDNSSPSAVRHTMETAERQLRGGMSLVVFPEGARTWNGKMRAFKRGAYKLAAEFGLPMVPITIDGAFAVMPRFKKLPHWGHITLTIHKPMPAPTDEHQLAQSMESTRAAILSALPEQD
ncbi:MAG: 1-acyl-sn-glycerol-3-phosphate acyltransferase [Muribaculaceae bacterium]|nr:1-acyl-sn-glycerol-3-phosphate acyltransferase [Muribaculaceae bacterium]